MFTMHGLYVALGAAIVIIISAVVAFKKKFPIENIFFVSPFALLGGFLGARLFYVIFCDGLYLEFGEKLKFTDGGYILYGGILGACAAIALYFIFSKNKKMILPILDIIAPGAAVGIAIGHLGSVFYEECFGLYIKNPAFQKLPFAVYISSLGEWCSAVFLYESAACLAIFGLLILVERFNKKPKINGAVFTHFLILYAGARTFLESLRYDSVYFGFVRISQVISAIILIYFFVYFSVKTVKKSGFTPYYPPLYIFFVLSVAAGFSAEFYMGSNEIWINYLVLGISCVVITLCTVSMYYFYRQAFKENAVKEYVKINRINELKKKNSRY